MNKILIYGVAAVFALLGCASGKHTAKTGKTTEPATTAASASATPSSAKVSANIAPGFEEQILILINKHRKKKGLAPLTANFVITSVARQHSLEMATGKMPFGHSGMDARFSYIKTRVKGVMSLAENVAYGSRTAEEVVTGWLNSPGHKKNIEGNYRLTGIGVARNVKSQLYFTQLFAN